MSEADFKLWFDFYQKGMISKKSLIEAAGLPPMIPLVVDPKSFKMMKQLNLFKDNEK